MKMKEKLEIILASPRPALTQQPVFPDDPYGYRGGMDFFVRAPEYIGEIEPKWKGACLIPGA